MRSSRDDPSEKETNPVGTGKFRFINTKSFPKNPRPIPQYENKIYDTAINNNYENNINNVDNQQSNVTNNICIIIKNAEKQKSKSIDKTQPENNNNPIYNYPNYNRSMKFINYTQYNNLEDLSDEKPNNYCNVDTDSENENKTSLRKTLHQKQKELRDLKNKIEYKQIVINNKKSMVKNKMYSLGYCKSNVNKHRNSHSITYKNNSMNFSNKKKPVSFVKSFKQNAVNYFNNNDINARKKNEITNLKNKIIENYNENKNNKIPMPSIDNMFNDIPMTNIQTCKYITNDSEDEKEKLNNSYNIIDLSKNNENDTGIKFNQSIKNKREMLGIPLNNNETREMSEKIEKELTQQSLQEVEKKVAMYKKRQEEILKNYEKQKLMQQKIRQEIRENNKSKDKKMRSQNNSFILKNKIHNLTNTVNSCKNQNMKKINIMNKLCDTESESSNMNNRIYGSDSYYRPGYNDNHNINYNRSYKNKTFITGDNCSEFDLGDNNSNYNDNNYNNRNNNNRRFNNNYNNNYNNSYTNNNYSNNNYNNQYKKNMSNHNKTSHNTHFSSNFNDKYLQTNDNYNNSINTYSNYYQSDYEQSDYNENNNYIKDYNYVNYNEYHNYNNFNNNNNNYYRNNNYLNVNHTDYFVNNNNNNFKNEYSSHNYSINSNPKNYNNNERLSYNNPNKSYISTISTIPNVNERYNTNIKLSSSIDMSNINNSNYSNYLYTEESEKQKNLPKKTYENHAPQKSKINNKIQNNPTSIKQIISTKEGGKILAIKNYEDGKTIRLIKKRKKNRPIAIQKFKKPMVNVSMSTNLINSGKKELNETKNKIGVNKEISAIRRINMQIQNFKNKNKVTLMRKRKKFDKKPQNKSYSSLTNSNIKKNDKAILKNKSIRTLPDQNKKNIFEASFGSKY